MAPPAAPRPSRRRLWITLGIVAAVVLVMGGGAAFIFTSYNAPASTASQFCGDLKIQSYTQAYHLLSSSLRGWFTQDQFTQTMTMLDTAEGKVSDCHQASGSNTYSYSLGASTATVTEVITRAKQGNSQGAMHLVNQSGGWKVDGLATSLVGVSVSAIQATNGYCQDLQTQHYTAAYQLLGDSVRGSNTQAQYVKTAQLQDEVDGTVTACSLVGLGQTNDDSTASIDASITRSKLGQRDGVITLTFAGSAWQITSVDQQVAGTDLSALLVAIPFCADINSRDYKDAYKLSIYYSLGGTYSEFASLFDGAPQTIPGVSGTISEKWSGCSLDPSTYTVSVTSGVTIAQVDATTMLTLTVDGQTTSASTTLALIFSDLNGAWLFMLAGPATTS
jgi:hypothetical protein